MLCLSCREEYEEDDAGTCKECYEEASETEEELKREIEDLRSRLLFLRLPSPTLDASATGHSDLLLHSIPSSSSSPSPSGAGSGSDADAGRLDTPAVPAHRVILESAWKKFLRHVGPGFMVCFAYLDPGNLETDLQAGANHKYELLWVILIGLIFALIIQSLSANLGVVTGRHLAELCKTEYPLWVKTCLWLLAEVAVIAADIPEVIGTAFAFNLLFNIPVWIGVLIAGSSTLLILELQRYGVRKLEFFVALLVFVMAACFFVEMSIAKPPAKEVIKGLFIPRLSGSSATGDAIALLGALVMPHNLFLHSALVLSRNTPASVRGMKDACRFFLIESGTALFVALLVNIAIMSVSGTVCNASHLSSDDAEKCSDLTLDSSSFLLKGGRVQSCMVWRTWLLGRARPSSAHSPGNISCRGSWT